MRVPTHTIKRPWVWCTITIPVLKMKFVIVLCVLVVIDIAEISKMFLRYGMKENFGKTFDYKATSKHPDDVFAATPAAGHSVSPE